MYGVVNGMYSCQQDRVDELNTRIYARNVPNMSPQMCFAPRPVPTQCTTMPIMDQVAKAKVPIKTTLPFNTRSNFLPGDSAPWAGFKDNVEVESGLFNMYFALQACPQAYYVPSSRSDMYNGASMPGSAARQPHPDLFGSDQVITQQNNLPCNIPESSMVFNNDSRQNVLNIGTAP